MYILHVNFLVKSDCWAGLTAIYHQVFCPAIGAQPGFLGSKLLAAKSGETWTHRLEIVFESEESQKAWGATEAHEGVWSKMEPNLGAWSVDIFELA
jgi:heme-degrading monooxygenase HmoA